MRREMSFYFLTLVLIVSSISFIAPNLSTDNTSYEQINKTIDSTRIIEREYEDKYGKNIEYTLAIVATDGYELYISKSNLNNWDSLNNVNIKGKRLKALLRNTSDRTGNKNPINLSIEGKTIISKKESLNGNYFLIGLTIFCTLYSFWLIKKRLKSN